ncbi:MAG: enoyl-CoA hydratase/isomerase family protein [Promethearchaeota archaeon]
MNYDNWLLELKDGVMWCRLNRPDKKNAFSPEVVEELYAILQEVEKKRKVRVLVLSTVMDDIFSSGADVKWFSTLTGRSAYQKGRRASVEPQHVFAEIERLPIPVICAVKGLNLTAGFEMMLCCDLIVAADNAKFGQIETKYALTPFGGGTQRLTRLVGPLKAREMIYLAKIVDAKEALEMGLVNEVVPLADLDARVAEIAAKIARSTPRAIKRAKFLVQLATYVNELGFRYEQEIAGESFASGEPMEAVMSFLQKGKKEGG